VETQAGICNVTATGVSAGTDTCTGTDLSGTGIYAMSLSVSHDSHPHSHPQPLPQPQPLPLATSTLSAPPAAPPHQSLNALPHRTLATLQKLFPIPVLHHLFIPPLPPTPLPPPPPHLCNPWTASPPFLPVSLPSRISTR
jgi:hypothetical protein